MSDNDSDAKEDDFWMPPVGDRWDFDDGAHTQQHTHSSSSAHTHTQQQHTHKHRAAPVTTHTHTEQQQQQQQHTYTHTQQQQHTHTQSGRTSMPYKSFLLDNYIQIDFILNHGRV